MCKKVKRECISKLDKYDINMKINIESYSETVNCSKSNESSVMGIFTSLVRIKGGKFSVVSVKSNKPIDKRLWVECSKAISRLHVGVPIKIGDIVCKNILNTGVDIVCTKNVEKFSE
jgi:CxxC motif-containing protein